MTQSARKRAEQVVARRCDEAPILRLSLQDIAFRLGGHVERGHVRAPGPGQSKTNRSMKVTVGSQYPDGFVVKWFAGRGQADDLRAKEDVLDRLGLEPWSPSSSSKRTKRPAAEIEAEAKTEAEGIKQTREKAGSIWHKKGNPKDPKGIVRAYHRARGLDEELVPTQRYLPASDKYPEPAMLTVVAAPREENGRLLAPERHMVMGVHITKLAADGSGKAGGTKDKILLGQRPRGERALPLVLRPSPAPMSSRLLKESKRRSPFASSWACRYGHQATPAGLRTSTSRISLPA
jgi:hypothetical protein